MLRPEDYAAIRSSIAAIPADVSNDAVGAYAPRLEDIYAPERHAAALDPSIPIVVGSRGAGKSFWSGVLGQDDLRNAAALAYPNIGLKSLTVGFGYTGAVGGSVGLNAEVLNAFVHNDASKPEAKTFWWATILRAAENTLSNKKPKFADVLTTADDIEARNDELDKYDETLRGNSKTLLIVYDALDTIATSWPRRRMLTEALIEVVWSMRAYRNIRLKLFLRQDQIDDDALNFVELPKLRTGAVQLTWAETDLYGLFYSRIALTVDVKARASFKKLLSKLNLPEPDQSSILSRRWPLAYDRDQQARVMTGLAGSFMAEGPHGYKKGRTYDWPLKHLGDAFEEVTPRSFLGLMIAAAKRGAPPQDRVITADGIRHGLREASKTRVDQLHLEFPWIKGVLAPLAGLLLPQREQEVFKVWKVAKTVTLVVTDAQTNNYLPPFVLTPKPTEAALFEALKRIGVMFRRKDDRIDMPDLFRVAAKLLKKGGTTPL